MILLAANVIVPTSWFARRAHGQYLMTMGYGAQLHNTSCDVAIYGDSAAMIGIYPEIIARRTGLSTCNLAEFEGMTMLNDTMVLDQFLDHNPRPRFIIFLYCPESMNPQSQRHNPIVSRFEAVTWRLRQPHRLAGLIVLMRHPEDVFAWAGHGVRLTLQGLFSRPYPLEVMDLRSKTFGRVPIKDPPLTSCDYPSNASVPDKRWMNGLRARYGRNGTTVLIDATLMPECDRDLVYFRNALAGLIDNPIDTLPIADYYMGGRHVNATGSVPLSNMVANQVLKHLAASPSVGAN
jgi:hypothetical protein